ncbi:N-formylglutamate amidohydrolase [Rhizobium sp. ARZ01]|uniref:N-formylglutamate amidohydrolase n=1 Tax=Rhizobium sp. ARZ01 TaxID=2769313 RepID=UPI00178551D7|nr:N-formylglutamate amidohydrolase [Rhizobium sp. ARZ01]MBD9371813.1 N-formylglutamate amidohydrolase [Rhizobium sp. ARZ01]
MDKLTALILEPKEHTWWTVHRGASPIVGTAIHDGHNVRADALQEIRITDEERQREEDPFTGAMIRDLSNQIIVHRSRFEIDLNRPRDAAVYIRPEQAWKMDLWREPPSDVSIANSLAVHDSYYAMLKGYLRDLEAQYGSFVVLDVHSYNHRRDGPTAEAADPEHAPEINIGTFSMDRGRWAPIVEAFTRTARSFDFLGRRLDVRENIAFQGRGEQTRFIHEHFPKTGCALAIEFKKFFMDEWTGVPDLKAIAALRALITGTVPVLEKALKEVS